MGDYQSRADLGYVKQLLQLAPVEGKAFLEFNHAAERDDGTIPRKYRELMALAVAFTTQCACCIDTHTRQARENGACREEIAEAAFVAAAVRAGGTLAHSLLSLRLSTRRADSFRGLACRRLPGAACVTRTRDPIITNDVLYQLS